MITHLIIERLGFKVYSLRLVVSEAKLILKIKVSNKITAYGSLGDK